jgi:putative transposase
MSTGRPRGFRFPWAVSQHAVWLYARFTLSLREVEELLAERGIVVTHETVRAWVARFGPAIARGLRARRGGSNGRWHLDEMFASVGGRRMCLRRAVDGGGEVLDVLLQARRDKAAALRLMRKLLRKQGHAPDILVTDRLASYAAAARELGLPAVHVRARSANNRAEGSHVPIRLRGRKMRGFRSPGPTQRLLSVRAAVADTFATFRHLVSAAGHRLLRADAFAAWRDAVARAA